jgi:hypothetical protein
MPRGIGTSLANENIRMSWLVGYPILLAKETGDQDVADLANEKHTEELAGGMTWPVGYPLLLVHCC